MLRTRSHNSASSLTAISYIDELLEENQRLREGSSRSNREEISHSAHDTPVIENAATQESTRNPLLEDRPWFFEMRSSEFPIHIGEAADAAFASRFRQALLGVSHSHIPRTHYASDERLVALAKSSCAWPMPARARFLVKVSLDTVCQYYHVVRKSAVLDGLERFLQKQATTDVIFESKLWALFALGEVYSSRTMSVENTFPGMAYFAQSTKVLSQVKERPTMDSIEVRLLLVRPHKHSRREITHR